MQYSKWPLILVADDTPADQGLLETILKREEYQVVLAADGAQALALAASDLPDLILLDVGMPVLDGIETCRRLKADPATRAIPVIFITGQTDTHDVLAGFQAGAVDYVTKPFHIPELLARVNVHMELQRARHEIRTLHGLLHSCAHCRKIRNTKGEWQTLESYLAEHSEAQFSHGLCPDCIPAFFPDFKQVAED
jgi:DNA-binding response OmpR family regulator